MKATEALQNAGTVFFRDGQHVVDLGIGGNARLTGGKKAATWRLGHTASQFDLLKQLCPVQAEELDQFFLLGLGDSAGLRCFQNGFGCVRNAHGACTNTYAPKHGVYFFKANSVRTAITELQFHDIHK
ncbi:hypothetical protein D3C85_1535920 [compost metagenome]